MASEPMKSSTDWIERARAQADVLVLSALIFVAVVVIYVAGRGMKFFFDEWDFVLGRRGNSLDTHLGPPPDVIPRPWYARIASSADTTVCAAK
jgi:hypothetical protein